MAVFNVLFLCTSNSARSILAEAFLNSAGKGRFKAYSAGSKPGAPKMDFVFTVCDNAAAEPCPYWPGQPITAHWGVPDPAAAEGGDEDKRRAFRQAFSALSARINLLIILPLEKLDHLSLKRKLEDIDRAGLEMKA